jgi:hypothetical protein
MTRNQKIAIGCGSLGCLGLIVLLVAGTVLYLNYGPSSSNYNRNYNANSSRNFNGNTNLNSNTSTSSSSMANDDKHKLFQAAGMTKDNELIQAVIRKLGFITANGGLSDDYATFIKEHMRWALNNADFVRSVNTADKARAYVDAHIND